MFVDSHCHLHLLELDKLKITLSKVIDDAIANKVTALLCVATNLAEHVKLTTIAKEFAIVKISVGSHPEHADQDNATLEEWLKLASDLYVVGIGETGLDYYYNSARNCIIKQQESFIKQIYIAKTVNKPLIIHSRMAKQDTINILTTEKALLASGVMHCFTEDWSMAQKALDLGFYISFSGIITFSNAAELRDVVKKVPLDRILIETDAPYLAPVPFRGKINQPSYVVKIAEKIAELKNISIQEVAAATLLNYKKLFRQ